MLCPVPDAHADYFARETRQARLRFVSQVTLPKREPDKSSPTRSPEVIDSRAVIYDFPLPFAEKELSSDGSS